MIVFPPPRPDLHALVDAVVLLTATGRRQTEGQLYDPARGAMTSDSFSARDRITVGDSTYEIFRLDLMDGAERLPYSLKVLLENLLCNEDGALVTAEQVNALGAWNPTAEGGTEVQFTPARVLLQDFTGVPCVVDLVAMRDAMAELGGDPRRINPLIPAELVIDHSVIADVFGRADAFRRNADLEFDRNQERYQLLRWAQKSFDDFLVVPPDTGTTFAIPLVGGRLGGGSG